MYGDKRRGDFDCPVDDGESTAKASTPPACRFLWNAESGSAVQHHKKEDVIEVLEVEVLDYDEPVRPAATHGTRSEVRRPDRDGAAIFRSWVAEIEMGAGEGVQQHLCSPITPPGEGPNSGE